ncbi:sensor histidine kinase [Streptomyces sp. NPDC058067]|uniref:sensor histidine kinase n=1 Tax=Streptomyces sp. NPDC058067 TaxID=3346324 RepID=UPI0036EF5B93
MTAPADEIRLTGMGQSPRNRREALRKLLWIGIWLVFMGNPIEDLLDGGHTAWATALGWLGLVSFVGVYLVLVFRHTARAMRLGRLAAILGALAAVALVMSLTLGAPWLVLFVYVSVSCGAVLPMRYARWSILAVTAGMVLLSIPLGRGGDLALVVPALLGGFAMTGVRQLVRTTVELRRARATVAQLAANEERLRLARDLHDLLGHSLSLITLKSELAGRMLPGDPEKAGKEVADIEQVSRQALVDVREAVTGYRRPRLAAELAGARAALSAAGIEADVPPDAPDGLPAEQEAALAWTLREAVTNAVRHSGARRCTVSVERRQTLDGPVVELTVEDDGSGAAGGTGAPGNGLTGLRERVEGVGGDLTAAPARGRGFLLVARVPVGSVGSGA